MSKLGVVGPRIGVWGLVLSLAACSGADKGEGAPSAGSVSELRSDAERVMPDVSEAGVAAESEQAFTFSFLHLLKAEENVAFSPHSISAALAMTTDAAAGATLDEIEQALHFPSVDEAFHRSQDALKLGLAARNREAIQTEERKIDAQLLRESNDIWVRDDAPPQESYLDTLARYYGVGVHLADFGNDYEGARAAINAKVAKDTRDLIVELLPKKSLDENTVAVLTNALYFKAPWASAFAAPQPGEFKTLADGAITTEMLKQQSSFSYYEGTGFVSVAVPYWGGELEMMLIVPDAGSYAEVRGSLSSELLAAVVRDRRESPVELTLPKFSLKSDVSARKALEALGMKTPFDQDAAEFPKLASPLFPQIYISDVFHQATVAIDEKGTEASAATAVAIAGISSVDPQPPQPKIVTVDRPFLFVIRDNPTGSVLFVGQVVDPTAS